MIVGMDYDWDSPTWVNAELNNRNRKVYTAADGPFTDPSQEAFWAYRSHQWESGDPADITPAMVNQGQLKDLLL